MNNIRHASVKQLANKIKGFTKYPRFAFLLGAGASRQSGIITAGEMIRFFKERIISEACPHPITTDDERETWLTEQDWYKGEGSEYCKLFEQFEPKEIGRQRYIESIIEGQEPSFGYVVLANLMASNYINTIITTNFDDLVYSACTSYTAIRPIVYAYGVLASEMRITAERPKILKLHGDYLYSPLKNTNTETAVQDANMARQLSQILSEYGLVVIGYSGGDKSVLEVISSISEKNDLYWCVRRGEQVNEDVERLLLDKGGFLVEIDGFDELLNEIRQIVGFDVGKMLGSIQDRQDRMIDKLKNFDPRYSADILAETVNALKAQAEQEAAQIKKIEALSYFTQAWKAQEAGDLSTAEDLFRQAVALDPNDAAAQNNLGRVLMIQKDQRPEEAEEAFRKAIELSPTLAMPHSNLGSLLLVKGPEHYVEAEELLLKAIALDPTLKLAYFNLLYLYRLTGRDEDLVQTAERAVQLDAHDAATNLVLASIHKKLGHPTESAKYASQARTLINPEDWYGLAALESISGNADAAIENLRKVTFDERGRNWAKRDPDFEWLRKDPRFLDIVDAKPAEESATTTSTPPTSTPSGTPTAQLGG